MLKVIIDHRVNEPFGEARIVWVPVSVPLCGRLFGRDAPYRPSPIPLALAPSYSHQSSNQYFVSDLGGTTMGLPSLQLSLPSYSLATGCSRDQAKKFNG